MRKADRGVTADRSPGSRSVGQPPTVWQPPGWSPQGAVDFLHGLVAEDAVRLAAWAQSEPDASWARWLRGLGLAALAHHRLAAAGLLAELPGPLREQLRGAYYVAVADAELHTQELAAVLAALARDGIDVVVFKGASLAHLVYPDSACRPMGDLDLWVTAETMPRARAALAGLGYVERGKPSRPLALQAGRDGEVQMTGTAAGSGLVELHWGMFAGEWLRRTAAVDGAGIRSRAVPVTLAGQSARALAAEDAIVQLAVHLAVNHQMAFPGLRGLVDVALLAQTHEVDWHAVAERARAWRVGTATWLVLSLAGDLLGLVGAEDAVDLLRPSDVRRRLLQGFVDGQAVLAGRDMTGGPRRFVFQLLLVDRPADALRLLGRALWPEASWLAARYGRAGTRVRVRHLATALRGRV